MTTLDIICSLGTLIHPDGRMTLARAGAWTATWEQRGGSPYATASATSGDAAVAALADEMCRHATAEALAYLDEHSPEGRAAAEAIRLALVEARYATDTIEDEMLNMRNANSMVERVR